MKNPFGESESTLTTRQREQARRLAKTGMTAEDIAHRIGASLIDCEDVIKSVERSGQIDPELIWAQQRAAMNLSPPTRELFVNLFKDYRAATHDNQREAIRQRAIVESTNIVRTIVAAHVSATDQRWSFNDLESVGTIAAIEAIDALLRKADSGTNPGSYIWEAVHGAVVEPDPDLHSRHHIVVKRRGEKGKHKRVQQAWPSEKSRDGWGMFTGERVDLEFGAPSPAVDDRWEQLRELCDDEEMMLLSLIAQGFTHAEVAKKVGCHVSTVSERLGRIREKVQRQRERDGDV